MTKRAALIVAGTVLVLASTAGCGEYNDHRGRGDAPVSGGKGDDTPAHVTNMPDKFGNVSAKCLAGFPGEAVLVTTKGIAMAFPYKECN